MESGVLRALKSVERVGEEQSKRKIEMAQLYVDDAAPGVANYAVQVCAAMETGESLEALLASLRKATQFTPVNAVQLRRSIADEIIEAGRYVC